MLTLAKLGVCDLVVELLNYPESDLKKIICVRILTVDLLNFWKVT